MNRWQPTDEDDRQFVFDFYWEVRRDRWGRIPYGLTFEFWAVPGNRGFT